MTVDKLNGQAMSTPLVTSYTYDANGNKATETLPDGEVTTYNYDALNRLTNESTTNPSGTTFFSQSYVLNDDGTRASSSESQVQPDGSTLTTASTWAYDADGRLTGQSVTATDSTVPADAASNSFRDTYTYDLVGNRMTDTHTGPGAGASSTTTYVYNGDDELTSQTNSVSGTTTNSYDANCH